ncbi:hypothetical protein B6D52_00340 [Candidatus Parcubacteria bacterium 4484_255]|nr:MAG: hypothetical protein B6D52_00340 [Candidatus Parcubacteria bacterium 4484_255]
MIITESKLYGIIRSQLKKSDKIGIVSCNSCARICGTGGQEGMDRLAEKLKKDGFNVVDTDLIGRPCAYGELELKKEELYGDTTIVLACDAGVYLLKKLFPGRKIISGLDSIGVGTWDKEGNLTLVRKFE